MAGVVTVKLLDALKDIGVDVSQKQGSNVKTLATKNKSSATKPGLLASERDTGGNFGTVLDIFKKEAQFIEGMNDVEQMAFLNNIMDYNEFGGKSIKVSQGQKLKSEFDEGLGTLKDDIESLQDKAKTMKDEAEVNLKSSEKDLDDFISTGGQPLKAKSDKYLGGSMHEEGQLRTAIRTFLKNEYKNGKIKLDETDQFRIMEYSPMMEDDPIKVFRKIYGDEAYNKAGTFPGAFEKGENFNHYELIFKENMGEDLLKVKDKKYTGDGTLVLTKQEEVFEPTPDVDDDGIPFAKGGRASFAGGKLVDEFIAMIVKKEPIEAMKEVNKVIGKKGKYKNLTQKDIDRIVEGTEDWIFQRDPDNLYVEDRPMFKQKDEPDTQIFKDSEGGIKGITMGGDDEFKKAMSEAMEEGMRESENMKRLGLDPTKMEDALKYDQMKEAGQLEKNITGLSDMSEADTLMQKYPGMGKELAEQIAKDPDPARKAQVISMVEQTIKMGEKGMSGDEIIDIFKQGTDRTKNSTGGRAGFMDGGASIINPESSMNNSSGLNYLLGEDDNSRVDFKNGLLVPPSKPQKPQDPMMKLMETYNTYQEALPGVSQETKKYLEQDFIKKLADQGFSINDFMTYRMQQNYANGGRAGYEEGGPIHSRLGQLNTGVSSAEEQLQQINQSIEQAQNTLGSAESGGGGASAVTPSVSGYESSGSELYDSSPAGEVTNPYVAPVGMNSLPSKPDNKFSNSGGISILDDPRYESSISGPENIMPSMPVNSSPFDMLDPSITNLNQLGPGKIDNQGQDPFRDPVTGGGQPSYGPGGGLGGLLGEGGGLPNIPKMPIRPMPMPDLGPPDPDAYLYQADGTKIYPNRPQPIDQMPMLSPDTPNSPLGNIMQATPSTGGGPSLTQTAISGGGVMPRPGPAIDPNNPLLQLQNSMNAGKLPGNNTLQAAANSNTGPVYYINGNTGEKIYNKPGAKQPVSNFTPEQIKFMQMTLRGSAPSALSDRPIFAPGPVQQLADGGIAGLRQGYAGGSLVDKGRRGFLKFLGGTAAGVVALKTGLAKILGKDSGAVSKKVIDEVIIDGGSGAPAWLQPLVNKALREGTDITKNNALKDGQVVKSLDTPTGKVDVYYDTRTGEVDVDYIGGNTALGESVNMRYTPGIADEGTKGVKPADEFEAVEVIPEGQMSSPNDYNVEFGENTTSNVKDLYSDTSELAELSGEKLLIKDISNSIQKKKVLKQMNENPDKFASDNLRDDFPDYDYGDINPNYD